MCCPSPIFKPFNLRCVKFDSTLSWLSLTNGVKEEPRRLQRSSIFPPPPPPPPSLVITQVKKSPKITTSSTSPYSYNTSFSPSSPHFRPDFSLLPIVYLPPHLTCRVGYHTSKPRESVVYCLRLVQDGIDVYLTIIPRVWMDSKSIGYWLRGNEGSRNNFFSTIQLVGQKRSRQNNFS